jgi:hypothetical protein
MERRGEKKEGEGRGVERRGEEVVAQDRALRFLS